MTKKSSDVNNYQENPHVAGALTYLSALFVSEFRLLEVVFTTSETDA